MWRLTGREHKGATYGAENAPYFDLSSNNMGIYIYEVLLSSTQDWTPKSYVESRAFPLILAIVLSSG